MFAYQKRVLGPLKLQNELLTWLSWLKTRATLVFFIVVGQLTERDQMWKKLPKSSHLKYRNCDFETAMKRIFRNITSFTLKIQSILMKIISQIEILRHRNLNVATLKALSGDSALPCFELRMDYKEKCTA